MRIHYTRIRCPNNLHAVHDSGVLLPVPHALNLLIPVFRSVLIAVRTDILHLPNQMNPSCPARAIIEA